MTGPVALPAPDADFARLAEAEWRNLRQEAAGLEYAWRETYRALIEAAYAEPSMRALYPFTSHWALRFSPTARPRLTLGGPSLTARGDGTYGVGLGFVTADLGCFATPQEAVAAAVPHLPADPVPLWGGGRHGREGHPVPLRSRVRDSGA
ncbi:DUF6193 family natural product biosynthesis protein [Streptomyces sp. NPDC093224]|uniref:DUF6193 family natural product biosynthesis protein n=1 Tax=Streptomyces sp. NPDC093224 TaxID=3155198 RepID=UPI0034207E90